MDRETIEEKDQRVTGKIREILQNKERSTGKKWHVWPLYKFTLPVLCAGVMLVGLMMSREQSAITVSNNSEPTAGDVFENSDLSGLEKSTDQIGAGDAKNLATAAVSPGKNRDW